MNSSRIRLTRIIAFNWYGFRTFIEVDGRTLICGETGTGKSALLDLIQFVLTAGAVKFNKAAAGESNARDLRGYCLCDTNTRQRDGQPRFLRRSAATVAALEFSWPSVPGAEPRRETWGMRIQYESPTSQPSYVRFFISKRVERADLCDDTGALFSEDLFRTHLKRDLEGDASFTSHRAFQQEMGVPRHLHFDDEQMRKTLPKAIAFELDSDYQRFIREFILEPGLPDVANTRRSLDALRQAEKRVTHLHDQQQRLERIATQNQTYQKAQREAELFNHLRYLLDHAEAKEKSDKVGAALKILRSQHSENQKRMSEAVAAKRIAQDSLDALKLVAGKEDNLSEFERLKREETKLAEEVSRLTAASKTARDYLADVIGAWERWLKTAEALGLKVDFDLARIAALRNVDTNVALGGLPQLVEEFHRIESETKERLHPVLTEIREIEAKRTKCERELSQLKAGRTAPAPLLDVLRHSGTTAVTFARVVEVLPEGEPWWGVIETLLSDVRNAVLVDSEADFQRARGYWKDMPKAEPLIHPNEIPLQSAVPEALSSFLETPHSVARRYIDWKLGRMVAVRDIDNLENYSSAATPEGAVQESPVRRHVTPEREFTLGEKGLKRLRAAKEAELTNVSEQLSRRTRERDDINAWLQQGRTAGLNQNRTTGDHSEIRQLPEKQRMLEQTKNSIRVLETPELRERLQHLKRLESDLAVAHQTIGTLKVPLTKFDLEEGRLLEDLESVHKELEETGISLHENRIKLPPDILDAEIEQRLEELSKSTSSWKNRRDIAQKFCGDSRNQATEARSLRQKERDGLLAAFPDEFGEFDANEEHNTRFDQRLEQIQEHDVKRFEALATERRMEWEKRLQEDVLDRLSERLKQAQQTIADFRRILGREIGSYRYHLTQTRDPLHRAFWALLDQNSGSLRLSDPLVDWKLKEEIEQAKQELMQAIDQPDGGDKRAAALLDYRNYNRYDLEMVPLGQGDESEGKISLQQSGRSLSGGEGQAPFFVAMLAAFHRVYDCGQRGPQSNLGLVVMDEAFSKLSAGHIADCLSLAEGFGLQLILAFPMDRLGTMVQHADSIIQCRVDRKADNKGVPTSIINDVIYWKRERALAAFVQ